MSEGHTYPDQETWLAARQEGIGASDAPAAIGVSPWNTQFGLWSEKVGLIDPPDLSNVELVEWGHRLEPIIGEVYAERTGRVVRPEPQYTIRQHPQYAFLLATLDATQSAGADRGVLQIKTTGSYHKADWDDEPPIYCQVQLQHEMVASGLTWGTLCVLIGGQELRSFDAERNDRFCERMIAAEQKFWDMVQAQEAPEPDGSETTARALAKLYPEDDGESVALPPESLKWDADLVRIKAEVKALETEKTRLENLFKATLGKASLGILPDGDIYTLKSQTKKQAAYECSFRVLRRKGGKP